MESKLAIIINGRGGVGKDTLCDYFIKCYPARKFSSIEPVKKIARACKWEGGKEEKDRKFLSDLKCLLSDYNDLPFNACISAYLNFLDSDKSIWFVMVREPDEIEKLKRTIQDKLGGRCATLLIRRPDVEKTWGNMADDNVEDYHYDYIFDNYPPIEAAQYDFVCLVREIERETYGNIKESLKDDLES